MIFLNIQPDIDWSWWMSKEYDFDDYEQNKFLAEGTHFKGEE